MVWELLNPSRTQNLQIYKDAIDLTSRQKVRFRQKIVIKMKQKVLYKLVLVADPLDYSGRINSSSNFGIIKNQQLKFVPILQLHITKDRFRTFVASQALWALRASSLEVPGSDI